MLGTHWIRLFVDDQVGVLDRISILVRRSGWNVKGIHSCAEPGRGGTRVVLTIEGRADLRLLLEQLRRLDCVRELDSAPHTENSGRELGLARGARREELGAAARRHGARLVESAPEEDIWELTGGEDAITAFLADCAQESGARTMRTGAISL